MPRIVKVAAVNSVVTLIRLVLGLLTNKMYAVLLGPAGYMTLGNITNAFNLAHAASQAGMSSGVSANVARCSGAGQKQGFLYAGICLSLCTAVVLVLVFLCLQFNGFFPTVSSTTTSILIVSLILAAPLGALIGYFNGSENNNPVYLAQLSGAILLLLVVWGCYSLGRSDLALATAGATALGAMPVLTWLGYRKRLHIEKTPHTPMSLCLRPLVGYLLIGAVSGVVAQTMQIAVRILMSNRFGDDVAGYWQASWRLSDAYLAVLAQTISMVLLPRYAHCQTRASFKRAVLEGLAWFAGGAMLLCLFVFIFADHLVLLLFSKDFVKAAEFVRVQVFGDFLKIISWVLAYVMLAKGNIRAFVITEIVAGTLFVGLTALAIRVAPSILDANYAYIGMYLAYTMAVLVIVIKTIKSMPATDITAESSK